MGAAESKRTWPMLVTEGGMVTDVKPEQPLKACCTRTAGGERGRGGVLLVRRRARGGRVGGVQVVHVAARVAGAQAHREDAGHRGGNGDLQRRAPLTEPVAHLHLCHQPARHLGSGNSARRALSDCLGRLARPRKAAPLVRPQQGDGPLEQLVGQVEQLQRSTCPLLGFLLLARTAARLRHAPCEDSRLRSARDLVCAVLRFGCHFGIVLTVIAHHCSTGMHGHLGTRSYLP